MFRFCKYITLFIFLFTCFYGDDLAAHGGSQTRGGARAGSKRSGKRGGGRRAGRSSNRRSGSRFNRRNRRRNRDLNDDYRFRRHHRRDRANHRHRDNLYIIGGYGVNDWYDDNDWYGYGAGNLGYYDPARAYLYGISSLDLNPYDNNYPPGEYAGPTTRFRYDNTYNIDETNIYYQSDSNSASKTKRKGLFFQ